MALTNTVDRFNGIIAGLAIKAPCIALADTNITLEGEQTINGVPVTTGDRVLCIAQTDTKQNGIYNVATTGWTRAADFDGNRDVTGGTICTVATTGPERNLWYSVQGLDEITIGSDNITFKQGGGPNVSYPLSTYEIAAGLTLNDIDDGFYYGNVLRHGALLTGGGANDDDTAAFNQALTSGHPAYCDVMAAANMEGTMVMTGHRKFLTVAGFDLQRFTGDSTDPLLHMYGNQNYADFGWADIRQDLYAYPSGIILIGPAVDETEGGTTDVQCYGNKLENFKLVGPENNGSAPAGSKDNGHPGVFVHSIRRKKYTVSNPTYDTGIKGARIVNCDRGLELSTDSNRGVYSDIHITQYKTHAVSAASAYGNQFHGITWESPLAWTGGSPRFAVGLKSQNYGTETGTDATYTFKQAYNNWFEGYCELTAGLGRLLDWDDAAVGDILSNYNRFVGPFVCSDGYGKDASTDFSGLGTNRVEGNRFYAAPGILHKFAGGIRFEPTDDFSGGIHVHEGMVHLYARDANMDEGTHYDQWEWDNFGGGGSSIDDSALIEVIFAAKAAEDSRTHIGKVLIAIAIENNIMRAPRYTPLFIETWGEDPIVQVVANVDTGTVTNTGKVTLAFETLDAPGITTVNYAAMYAQIVPSTLFGTTLDWKADLKKVDTTYATAAQSLGDHKLVDRQGNAQIVDRQSLVALPAVQTVDTADGTYSGIEQQMLNDLKADVENFHAQFVDLRDKLGTTYHNLLNT